MTKNNEAFYYTPLSQDLDKISISDRNGKILQKEIPFDSDDIKHIVGIICYHVASGFSLTEIATGDGWRPTVTGFLNLVAHNGLFYDMYSQAREDRLFHIEEKLVSCKDEDEFKRLHNLSKVLRGFQKEEKSQKEEKEPKHLHVHWVDLQEYAKNRFKKTREKDSKKT